MSKNIYFGTGVFWELPEKYEDDPAELASLISGIQAAMQRGEVYPLDVTWPSASGGPGQTQKLLLNGGQLPFIAIGDPGHISR